MALKCSNRFIFLFFFIVVVDTDSIAFEKGINGGFLTAEGFVECHGVLAVTFAEQLLAET